MAQTSTGYGSSPERYPYGPDLYRRYAAGQRGGARRLLGGSSGGRGVPGRGPALGATPYLGGGLMPPVSPERGQEAGRRVQAAYSALYGRQEPATPTPIAALSADLYAPYSAR